MPTKTTNWHLPRNQSAHRIAAIALYRALLSQCRALSNIDVPQQEALQNLIRNRFRQARHEQATQRLRLHFEAGYEALDRLDAAVAGQEAEREYLLNLLTRAPGRALLPPPHSNPSTLKPQTSDEASAFERPERPKVRLEDRPLPREQLSGKRRVPHLYNAQGIPVLRFTKPQPENLSGYINHRLQLRQKRHDERHRLVSELEWARAEDRWDQLMDAYGVHSEAETSRATSRAQAGVGILGGFLGEGMGIGAAMRAGKKADERPWSYAVALARKEVERKLNAEKEKNRIMSEKMQGIVDREREVYEREKVVIKTAKKAEYERRKTEVKAAEPESEKAEIEAAKYGSEKTELEAAKPSEEYDQVLERRQEARRALLDF